MEICQSWNSTFSFIQTSVNSVRLSRKTTRHTLSTSVKPQLSPGTSNRKAEQATASNHHLRTSKPNPKIKTEAVVTVAILTGVWKKSHERNKLTKKVAWHPRSCRIASLQPFREDSFSLNLVTSNSFVSKNCTKPGGATVWPHPPINFKRWK